MGGTGLEDGAGAAAGGQEARPRAQGSQWSQPRGELWPPAGLHLPSPWDPGSLGAPGRGPRLVLNANT